MFRCIARPRYVVCDSIRPHACFHKSLLDFGVDDIGLELFLDLSVDTGEVPADRLPKFVHNGVGNVDRRSKGQLVFAPNEFEKLFTDPIAFERVHISRVKDGPLARDAYDNIATIAADNSRVENGIEIRAAVSCR